MSSINIMLLGLLGQKPRNAYEINKTIEHQNVRSWLSISDAAVYRNLRKLRDAGHLSTHVEKDGLMPEKTIYTVTEGGQIHFIQLIEKAAHKPIRMGFEFDAWISHLHHLPAREGQTLLTELRDRLDHDRGLMSTLYDNFKNSMPPGASALVRFRLSFLTVATDWAADLSENWEAIMAENGGTG